MYPYREYMSCPKKDDPVLLMWRDFNDQRGEPWAITHHRDKAILWVWGEPHLPANSDEPYAPTRIHASAIRESGNGFESKLDTYLREQRRKGRAA